MSQFVGPPAVGCRPRAAAFVFLLSDDRWWYTRGV